MKIKLLMSGAIASVVLASASAIAGDLPVVQPAEFGRDGVPRVTVTSRVPADAVHAQAFGRGSPALRQGTTSPQPFTAGVPSRGPERFGRS